MTEQQSKSFQGVVASPGIAYGKLFLAFADSMTHTASVADVNQKNVLLNALDKAGEDLSLLLETLDADDDASGMLEFQLAMIEDNALREPALQQIEAGKTAQAAWQSTLDGEIQDYQNADDEYFQARASDLKDIRARVVDAIHGKTEQSIPQNQIYFGEDLAPSCFLATSWGSGGIALTGGSVNAHVAMLARSRNIPMLIGLKNVCGITQNDCTILNAGDSDTGDLLINANSAQLEHAKTRSQALTSQRQREQQYLDKQAVTKNGKPVSVMINIAAPEELDHVKSEHCDGIGLVRTEFLFCDQDALPDEEQQLRIYRKILNWAGGKPVTVRTLDAGGDKPVRGLTKENEQNPFLGMRGIRLSLKYQDIFATQLRALLRASAFGQLKIMLPMVGFPSELEQAKNILSEQIQQLNNSGVQVDTPPLGIMVEVPSAAICIDEFKADFFSIGSNDLLQYVTACSRDATDLVDIAKADNPAVLKLIKQTIEYALANDIDVSVCGEMAGQAEHIETLLTFGLPCFSVSPGSLATTKAVIIQSDCCSDA